MIKLSYNEILRKIVHISSLIVPLSYLFFIVDKESMLTYILIAINIAFLIEISRIKFSNFQNIFNKYFGLMLRGEEKNGKITGATWMLLGWFTTILLFPIDIAVAALIFLSIGDAIAGLIGKTFPIYKVKDKTISGTLAGIIVCVSSVLILNPSLPLCIIIIGAVSAMFIELLPLPLDDNLTIPNFSGIVMFFADYIL